MTDKRELTCRQIMETLADFVWGLKWEQLTIEGKKKCEVAAECCVSNLESLGLLKDVQPAQERDWLLNTTQLQELESKLKTEHWIGGREYCYRLLDLKRVAQAQIDYLREMGVLNKSAEWERDLFKQALDKWGAISQIDMAFEEMAELQQILCKAKRNDCTATLKLLEKLTEETTDVELMIDQIKYMFGFSTDETRRVKLERLKKLLAQVPEVKG